MIFLVTPVGGDRNAAIGEVQAKFVAGVDFRCACKRLSVARRIGISTGKNPLRVVRLDLRLDYLEFRFFQGDDFLRAELQAFEIPSELLLFFAEKPCRDVD